MSNNKREMTALELFQNVMAYIYLSYIVYLILQALSCLCCGVGR